MKVKVSSLHDLGIDTVDISIKESYKLTEVILNNAISDTLITDFSDDEVTEYEALIILIAMGYFDRFNTRIIEDFVAEDTKYKDISDIHTSESFNSINRTLINNVFSSSSELLQAVSTVYDFNKKQLLDKLGYAFSGKIDTFTKELLTKSLTDDLINLVQDYNRTLNKILNDNIGLSGDDLIKKLEELKNTPLINRNGKSTKRLGYRIKDIARTMETLIKAQAVLNTGLQLGVNDYDIVTAGDSRVCPICIDIASNNPYNIDSCIVPPFHVQCRCQIKLILHDNVNEPVDIDKFYDIISKSWIQV